MNQNTLRVCGAAAASVSVFLAVIYALLPHPVWYCYLPMATHCVIAAAMSLPLIRSLRFKTAAAVCGAVFAATAAVELCVTFAVSQLCLSMLLYALARIIAGTSAFLVAHSRKDHPHWNGTVRACLILSIGALLFSLTLADILTEIPFAIFCILFLYSDLNPRR